MVSSVFGVPRVNIEKLVFAYQFGGFNALANANTNYAVTLFVDFSWIGVGVISYFLGHLFRVIERSGDIVLVSIGYLMAFKLLNGPFLGLFLSAGFSYVVLHSLFLRFGYKG